MRATRRISRMNDRGMIFIPKEIREELKLKDCDPFEIFIDDDCIILKKYNTTFNGKSYGI